MDLGLTGKHVLITGGTRGIGLACARLYLEEGARVSLCGRSAASCEAALRQLGAGERVDAHVADVIDPAAVLRLVDEAETRKGGVDILVNSAGAAARRPFAELDSAAWHAAMEAKFHTYMNATDVVIKRMAARKSGSVVNVIGMGGKFPSPIHLAGGSANAALMLATAGLASAYASSGVRVNAVNPTLTATERMNEGLEAQARQDGISVEEARQRASSKLPLQRIATPEEVANVVVFLSSARASYVSGAIVNVDGASSPSVV
jgi:NAD(P)-dependent dehydrogenase (short-subunit alcohol dehydrogenase family)